MAPALLTNNKLADKKGKQSSKQNKRKMDPENHIQEESNKEGKISSNNSEEVSKQIKVTPSVDHSAKKTVLDGSKKMKAKKSRKNNSDGELSASIETSEKKSEELNLGEDLSKLLPQKKDKTDLNSDSGKAEKNGSIVSPVKSRKRKNKNSAVDGETEVKVPKQDITKPDLEPDVMVDLTSLKLKLSSEDNFISSLLTNIPSQSVSIPSKQDSDESSNEMEETETDKPDNRASNPEELKQRLAAKLNQFQGKKLDFSEKKMKSKLKKKLDKLEKKKLKRKQSKMRSKIARLAQDTTKKVAVTSTASSDEVKTEVEEPAVQNRLPKPIFNSEGRMVFSKFDFGEGTAPTWNSKKITNDPKAALGKIKKIQEKVETLKEKGDKEKAKLIEEQKAWHGALQRAEGVKVKDSAELLSKTIKRNEKKKQQSKKKWDERIATQEKSKEDKQKKRSANIKGKKDQKKEKKLARLSKRGRV